MQGRSPSTCRTTFGLELDQAQYGEGTLSDDARQIRGDVHQRRARYDANRARSRSTAQVQPDWSQHDLGRNYIGIELNPAYVEMAARRIVGDAPMFNEVTE